MKLFCAATAGAALLATSLGATAADTHTSAENRFYIAPAAHYTSGHSQTFKPSSHGGLQLSIGKTFHDYLAIEATTFATNGLNLGQGDAKQVNIAGYGVSALFFPARHTTPVFIEAGVGLGRYHFSQNNQQLGHQHNHYYDLGVGYVEPINDYGVSVRGEFRYRRNSIEMPHTNRAHSRDHVWSLGIQIPLQPAD